MNMQLKAILSGLASYLPGYSGLSETGGASSARYCYSVWFRHYMLSQAFRNSSIPHTVLELGPGSSLGVGLSALLTGVDRYFAVDAVSFSSSPVNVNVLEELEVLFSQRENIPDDDEFPKVNPKLENYTFPHAVLDSETLKNTLSAKRLAELKQQLRAHAPNPSLHIKPRTSPSINYIAPWHDSSLIEPDSVDFILSQAVMEHVDNLDNVYKNCSLWLKQGGIMSHQIDFKSHGKSTEWNGHWAYPDWIWQIIVGTRPFLINRQPLSSHLASIRSNGFEILNIIPVKSLNRLSRKQLATPFRGLSEEDLTTSGAAVIAKKSTALTSMPVDAWHPE